MKETTWEGAYDTPWRAGEDITAESFSHPAKMARGLLERIILHGFERGWWTVGSIVADPFAGVFTTGVVGAYHGLKVIGCELEPRFFVFAQWNISLHRRKWEQLGCPIPVCIQGDSRNFAALIGQVAGCLTSPPFVDSLGTKDKEFENERQRSRGRNIQGAGHLGSMERYGTSPGQIGAMKAGDLGAVLTSPPYAESLQGQECGIDFTKAKEGGKRKTEARAAYGGEYGATEGQIGAMKAGDLGAVISSPPYAETEMGARGEGPGAAGNEKQRARIAAGVQSEQAAKAIGVGYGVSPGQIGALKAGDLAAVVSSPPWEQQEGANAARKHADPAAVADARSKGYASGKVKGHFASKEAILRALKKADAERYGDAQGQIGQESGQTYWQAVRDVYSECMKALRPGGMLVLVVKGYISKGKLVDLPAQTLGLLVHLGFEPVERIRAMLVKETRHPSLFGGHEVKRTKRVSFFRRLAEAKGSPAIDWETVLCVRKP